MSTFYIHIFHKNLNILRKIAGLKKSEFSAMLGVKNVFRKDYNSIGPKLLYGIQKHFDGVDEKWLLEDHDYEKIDIMVKKEVAYGQKAEDLTSPEQGLAQDSDRGSYEFPDLSKHKVKTIMASISPEEMCLIEALREIDAIGRVGILSAAINQLNEAKRSENVRGNMTKIKKIDMAIKVLSRAISETD